MSKIQMQKALAAWPEIRTVLFMPHHERAYRQSVKLLDRVIDEVGEHEDHPLASLMEVIGVLIERYEDEKVPIIT